MSEEKKKPSIEALDISRVKNVTELIIKPNYVLIQVINNSQSGLILPDNVGGGALIYKIIKVGSNINTIEVGDIVIDLTFGGVEYMTRGDEKYILSDVYNILLASKLDNYDTSYR